MAKKGKKERRDVSEEELAHGAIKAGLGKLIYSNPGLRDYSVMISNNVDYKKVNDFISEMNKKYGDLPGDKKAQLIYTGLAKYAAEGSILKDATIQTLFDASQEGKLNRNALEKIADFFKPNRFGGAKYFEKARNVYSDMHDMLSQNEAAQQQFPELTKAAQTLKNYGFLNAALKNFKAHGMLDEKEFRELHDMNYETAAIRAEKGKRSVVEHIRKQKEDLEREEAEEKKAREEAKKKEESGLEQKIAAGIIGGIGILMTLSNIKTTGAVIGYNSVFSIGVIGVFLIFFAMLLYLRPFKKRFKK